MGSNLKIAALSVAAAVLGALFLALAATSLSQGYAVVGRLSATTIVRAASPTEFYLVVIGMAVLGMVLFGSAVVMLLARGARKERLLAYMNATVFAVRPTLWWLGACVSVLLGVLMLRALVRT
jgi:hypothetical protein